MQQYSVVLSIHGWSAKHIATNKVLAGESEDMPRKVWQEVIKLVRPSANSLCIASLINVDEHSEFNKWFIIRSTPLSSLHTKSRNKIKKL